ncbi:acyltransferase family protein [Amycolatopsis jiangsuensis]|uniref:Peptidoglycan/LPS O-acetylase OafA/YrhL n=1 Tax=Amycolatopsis jiangsuensis TaxID=1181879 RepID=A0A840IW39_9PSEU|nr:acyltransferase [Amycolatopsis jiangsuensis]MBB4685368.1 peptidoglycan/LPS O-acetylase OafA/YrhL [Amycolatopsis jiangsuensis]
MPDVQPPLPTAVRAAEPTAATKAPHSPALDGIRGVAILGVLLFHTGHLPGGFLGVDLFFALSGYLITGLLLREVHATGTVSLISFWGRRIRRLFPALAVLLAVVTVVVRLVGDPGMLASTLADGPWVQLNLVNWHLLAESAAYWDRFGPSRVFEHLWSIAVEEQFYLLWPVIVLALGRRVRHRVALVAVLASALSLVLMILLVDPADPTRVYTGTDTRAFSLLLGAVVAARPPRTGRWGDAAMAVLMTGLAALWVFADGTGSGWLYTGGLFAHSLAAALLIGLCAQQPRALASRLFACRPLRWFGLISYSLYLWHWPVFVLLSPERTGLDGWAHTAVVCAVSIVLATLSKYFVEDPIRFRARWARGRRGVLAFTAATVVLALLWTAMPEPAPPAIDLTQLS